jgi:hypothetical protein
MVKKSIKISHSLSLYLINVHVSEHIALIYVVYLAHSERFVRARESSKLQINWRALEQK